MKRVAFDITSLHAGIDKPQIKGSIMTHQNGSGATVVLDSLTHRFEDTGQCFPLRMCNAQRMKGIDADEFNRSLFNVGAIERLYICLLYTSDAADES